MVHPKKTMIMANVVGGFMWWWVLWHLWHEHEHLTVSFPLNLVNFSALTNFSFQGEFDYPDVSKWTDAELGIPPDDAE